MKSRRATEVQDSSLRRTKLHASNCGLHDTTPSTLALPCDRAARFVTNFVQFFRIGRVWYFPRLVQAVVTDVCVPISNLPEIIVKTKEDISQSSITGESVLAKLSTN